MQAAEGGNKRPLDDDDDESLEDVVLWRRPVKQRSKTSKKPKLSICLSAVVVTTAAPKKEVTTTTSNSVHVDDSYPPDDADRQAQVEDSLQFFADTHEDQDPVHQQYLRNLQMAQLHARLAALDQEDRQGRLDIDALMKEQMQSRTMQTAQQIEKYQQKATAEQTRDAGRLLQLYQQKKASNQQKIQQGIQMLQTRHTAEMQQIASRHRQQAQQRGLPADMAAAEFQAASAQITAKQQRQIADFTAKGEEVKKRTDSDYQTESDKVRKSYENRMGELEANRQKFQAKLQAGFQQLRQRYLKRHLQKIMKAKDDCLTALKELQEGRAPATETKSPTAATPTPPPAPLERIERMAADKEEMRHPDPLKTVWPWAEGLAETAGAASRHKHRKTILSQIGRQLAVELHNEGLWVSSVANSDEEGKKTENSESHEFILWGSRAHMILESIVCGEIPPGFERMDFGEAGILQGGQIRCVITDLRTSDELASVQRASAVRELEELAIADLEKKAEGLHGVATEAEKSWSKAQDEEKEAHKTMENATRDVEKVRRMQEEFNNKFRNYIGPDGKVIKMQNQDDQQQLQKALFTYNANVEKALAQEKNARQGLSDLKSRLQKLHAVAKTTQKNYLLIATVLRKRKTAAAAMLSGEQQLEPHDAERSSTRVKDVIAALRKAADKRRDNMNEKKSNNSWLQSHPGVPTSLKKSLWHKMHRRKHPIILRPTPESSVNELRSKIVDAANAALQNNIRPQKQKQSVDEQFLKAEQLFLLATHPCVDEQLPTAPQKNSNIENWAEPGWHVILDIPPEAPMDRILPCRQVFPVLERNISEILSAPGRQAASLLKTSHFRCLSSPLSAIAVASSPAETGGSVQALGTYLRHCDGCRVSYFASLFDFEGSQAPGDPLAISDEAMSSGYHFSLNLPPPSKLTTQARRKSGGSDTMTAPSTKKQHAKSTKVNMPSAGTSASRSEPVPRKPEPQRRKNSKSSSLTQSPAMAPGFGDGPGLASSPRQVSAQGLSAPQASPAAHYNQYMNQMAMQQQSNVQRPPQQVQPQGVHQQFAQHPQSQPPQYTNPPSQQQMAQMRMMQQQSPSSHRPQVNPNFPPPQPMQMQQFYAPLAHPNAPGGAVPQFPQQPAMSPMQQMQGRPTVPLPPQAMPNAPQQQQQQQQNQSAHNESQNDPLFMLK